MLKDNSLVVTDKCYVIHLEYASLQVGIIFTDFSCDREGLQMYCNHIGGVMLSMLTSSVVDHVLTLSVVDRVLTSSAVDHVLTSSVVDRMLTSSAVDRVLTSSVVDHVLTSSAVDRGFEPWSGQTED